MAICLEQLSKRELDLFNKLIKAVGEPAAFTLLENSDGDILTDPLLSDLIKATGNINNALVLLTKKYQDPDSLDITTVEELYPNGILVKTDGEKDISGFVSNLSWQDSKSFLEIDSVEELFNERNLGVSMDDYLAGIKTVEDMLKPQVFEVLSELVTAAVDNAKLLILNKLGLKDSLLRPVSISVAYGMDLKNVISIISNPEVSALMDDYVRSVDVFADPDASFLSLREFVENSETYRDADALKGMLDNNVNSLLLFQEFIESSAKTPRSNIKFKNDALVSRSELNGLNGGDIIIPFEGLNAINQYSDVLDGVNNV